MNNVNPLLERIKIPGETIRLPSNGVFYTNGELDNSVTNGEIHIYPLTAISELLLRSPDKLLEGEALIDVFGQCAPQVKQPLKLLSKDIDYILTSLRRITYGDNIEIVYTHSCKDAVQHEYTVKLSDCLSKTKVIDPFSINRTFTFTTENGQLVKIQPMRFEHVMDIMKSSSAELNDKELGEKLIRSVSYVILSVDDVHDNDHIYEWLHTIPSNWFSDISKAIERGSDWGVDFKYPIKCIDCGKEELVSITLNPLTFFI